MSLKDTLFPSARGITALGPCRYFGGWGLVEGLSLEARACYHAYLLDLSRVVLVYHRLKAESPADPGQGYKGEAE